MTVLPAVGSSLPAVKTALISLLTARPGLSGVLITWSPTGSAPDEMIVLDQARAEITSATIGAQRREERYTLDIVISVIQSTGDQSLPTTRAFVLRDEVAAQLRSDATLGGVCRWAVDAGWETQERSNGTRSECQLTMHVDVADRI